MMQFLLTAFLALNLTGVSGNLDIREVRTLYIKAAEEEKYCKAMLERLDPVNQNSNPLMAGYKGCATMLMAKHVFNPFSKWSYFKKGRNILEGAIAADTNNIELRYLRFTVQSNVPGFLGYKNKLSEDKAFLLNSLEQVQDPQLNEMILKVL